MKRCAAVFCGALFAVGLVVGGMTQPAKVINFLDVGGNWDPSLACVLGGAALTYGPIAYLVRRRRRSLFGNEMKIPEDSGIDVRLVGGAAIFGVGWGLVGFCPGPGLVSAAALTELGVAFVAGMGLGFLIYRCLRVLGPGETSSSGPEL